MSTATPWYYHTPDDTPDRLDYPFMARNVHLAFDILKGIVFAKEKPEFIRKPPAELSDAKLLQRALKEINEHADELGMDETGRKILDKDRQLIDKIIAKGKLGSRERRNMWKIFLDIYLQIRLYQPK